MDHPAFNLNFLLFCLSPCLSLPEQTSLLRPIGWKLDLSWESGSVLRILPKSRCAYMIYNSNPASLLRIWNSAPSGLCNHHLLAKIKQSSELIISAFTLDSFFSFSFASFSLSTHFWLYSNPNFLVTHTHTYNIMSTSAIQQIRDQVQHELHGAVTIVGKYKLLGVGGERRVVIS